MNKLILVNYQIGENKKLEKKLFCNTYEFNSFFNPFRVLQKGIELKNILVLEISGKTYKQKAAHLKNLAIDFENFNCLDCDVDFSQNEIAMICGWFEKKAARFGLTKEFKNEGII